MPVFGPESKKQLATAHPLLQQLFNEVIKTVDCKVTDGYRNKEDQEKAFKNGASKAHYGQSYHNTIPAQAVDVIPYPVDWNDIPRFVKFAEFVLETAKRLNINIRWGGGKEFLAKGIDDKPHYELVNTIIANDGHHD